MVLHAAKRADLSAGREAARALKGVGRDNARSDQRPVASLLLWKTGDAENVEIVDYH
jgi:hypothetical protein